MPVKKAAIKALSRATKQRAFNENHKIAMKKSVKELKKAVVKGTGDLPILAVKAQSLIGKALKSKVLHKNTAARKQSQVAKLALKK